MLGGLQVINREKHMPNKPAEPVANPDPARKTSAISGPTSDEATVSMDLANAKCVWNDAEYATGDRVSNDGKTYECSYGRWVEVE